MLANIWTGKTGALCKIKDWFAAQTIGKTDITRWEIRPLCKNLAPAFAFFFAAFAFFLLHLLFLLYLRSSHSKKRKRGDKTKKILKWHLGCEVSNAKDVLRDRYSFGWKKEKASKAAPRHLFYISCILKRFSQKSMLIAGVILPWTFIKFKI